MDLTISDAVRLLQRPMVIIVTIKTNGVSFSLVAGACCFVKMSNIVTKTGIKWTLNINSTGAKNVIAYWLGGSWTNITIVQASSGHDSQSPTLSLLMWVVYDGSTYVATDNNGYMTYPDYSD